MQIEFSSKGGLSHSADRLHTPNFGNPCYNETMFSDGSWLVEIAAQKTEHYPNLESTVMSELDVVKGTVSKLSVEYIQGQRHFVDRSSPNTEALE